MIEYQRHLDFYSKESGWFSKIPETEWGDIEIARIYLEKFWLQEAEYNDIWKPIQDKIFINQDKGLPELLFAEPFKTVVNSSGRLFVKEDFEKLKLCMQALGDMHFVIITNTFGLPEEEPSFKMKYPSSISWDELISGNFISATIIESLYNEYFVFSESALWGRYSANDFVYPIDIVGYKKKCADIFESAFKSSNAEQDKIKNYLPENFFIKKA